VKPIYHVLIGVLAGFLLAGGILFVARTPAGEPVTLQPAPTKAPIVVQVDGAVPRPGVYELPEGSRVQDAVTAAGGLLAEADSAGINLAARLEDGQQLNIPYGREFPAPPEEPAFAVAGTAAPSSTELININTASAEELDSLPGIGPTTAQKIIDYRTQHGIFQRIEDIMNVSGIGPATFDRIKDLITVGP
jgi:competence protein ComEA